MHNVCGGVWCFANKHKQINAQCVRWCVVFANKQKQINAQCVWWCVVFCEYTERNQCTMCVVVCGVLRIHRNKSMHNVWCANLCNQNLTMVSVCAVYKTITKHLSNIEPHPIVYLLNMVDVLYMLLLNLTALATAFPLLHFNSSPGVWPRNAAACPLGYDKVNTGTGCRCRRAAAPHLPKRANVQFRAESVYTQGDYYNKV